MSAHSSSEGLLRSIPDDELDNLMTTSEVCAKFKVQKEWLYDAVEKGITLADGRKAKFPHLKFGRRSLRFEEWAVKAFLRLCRRGDYLSIPEEDWPAGRF